MRVRELGLFVLAFVLFYGSADLLTGLHDWRIPIPFPKGIPFWPEWAVVYLSLDLLLVGAYWKVPKVKLSEFTMTLLLATVLAWPFFVLLPLAAVPADTQVRSGLFAVADLLNLENNLFPSLHVAYAAIAALYLRRSWVWLWSLAVMLSTVLLHQHHPVDIVGGILLAFAAQRLAKTPTIQIEISVLQETVRCATRHRRYALIGAALFATSLLGWKRRRLARVGFCFLQRLDDLLDGQLASDVEPLDIAAQCQRAMRGDGDFPDPTLQTLGACLKLELAERSEAPGEEWVHDIIEEMKIDRLRVVRKALLSEEELQRHLDRTFSFSLDLMLLAADSPIRSGQIPHLVRVLGWCSVVRDWEEDLELGLVNVPKDHWRNGTQSIWLRAELKKVGPNLEKAALELQALRGVRGQRLLNVFWRSVRRYAVRGEKGGPKI